MRNTFVRAIVIGVLVNSSALAAESRTNPIDNYAVTVTNGKNNTLWGWIELKNGAAASGYIYFSDKPSRTPYLRSC